MRNKRQYLGSADIRQDYWSGGKDSRELKLNETLLYAEINCCNSIISISESYAEAQKEYNKQDLMYLCLVAVERSGSDYTELAKYGNTIGNLVMEGKIYRTYYDVEQENNALDNLIEEMESRKDDDNVCELGDFMAWFNEKVLAYNCYRNYDGSITYDKPKLMQGLNGLGGGSDSFSEQMVEGGAYMLYLLNKPQDVYEGCVDEIEMSVKMRNQKDYVEWLGNSNTNMTYDSILVNGRMGIIEKTKKTPEKALQDLKNGEGVDGLGELVTAVVVAIITAVATIISVIGAIVTALIQAKSDKYAMELANSAPDDNSIRAASPDTADYGHEKIAELEKRLNKAESSSDIYEKISSPGFIAGIVIVFTAIFGAAIYSSRKKKRNNE